MTLPAVLAWEAYLERDGAAWVQDCTRHDDCMVKYQGCRELSLVPNGDIVMNVAASHHHFLTNGAVASNHRAADLQQ